MIEIDTPDAAAADLRRLGRLDTDELEDLRDGLREGRLDAEAGERQLSRPVAPGRAAKRKRQLLAELAEVERTLLEAEKRVLNEQIARYEAGDGADDGDDRGDAHALDDGDHDAVARTLAYEAEDGWVGHR